MLKDNIKSMTQIRTGYLVCLVIIYLLLAEVPVDARGGGRGGSSRYRGSRYRGGGGGGDIPWWTPLVAIAGAGLIVGVGIAVTKWEKIHDERESLHEDDGPKSEV